MDKTMQMLSMQKFEIKQNSAKNAEKPKTDNSFDKTLKSQFAKDVVSKEQPKVEQKEPTQTENVDKKDDISNEDKVTQITPKEETDEIDDTKDTQKVPEDENPKEKQPAQIPNEMMAMCMTQMPVVTQVINQEDMAYLKGEANFKSVEEIDLAKSPTTNKANTVIKPLVTKPSANINQSESLKAKPNVNNNATVNQVVTQNDSNQNQNNVKNTPNIQNAMVENNILQGTNNAEIAQSILGAKPKIENTQKNNLQSQKSEKDVESIIGNQLKVEIKQVNNNTKTTTTTQNLENDTQNANFAKTQSENDDGVQRFNLIQGTEKTEKSAETAQPMQQTQNQVVTNSKSNQNTNVKSDTNVKLDTNLQQLKDTKPLEEKKVILKDEFSTNYLLSTEERFAQNLKSAQTVQQTVPFTKAEATLVKEANVPAQILSNIKFPTADGKTEYQIQLNPEFLGKINIKMVIENQKLTIDFIAQTQKGEAAIRENMSMLETALKFQDVHVDRINVTYDAFNNMSSQQESSNSFMFEQSNQSNQSRQNNNSNTQNQTGNLSKENEENTPKPLEDTLARLKQMSILNYRI